MSGPGARAVRWALLVGLLSGWAAGAQELERVTVSDPAELEGLLGEQWYGVYFQGVKSGWARTRLVRGGTPEAPLFLHQSAFQAELTANGQRTRFELHEEQVYDARPPFLLRGALTRMRQDESGAERRLEPRPGERGGWRMVASVDGGPPQTVDLPGFEYGLADELAASLWVRRRPAAGARLAHPRLEADRGELHTEVLTVQAVEERRAAGVPFTVWRVKWVGQRDEQGAQLLDGRGVVLAADMQGVCEMRLEPEAVAREPGAAADLFAQGQVPLTRPPGSAPLGDGADLVRLRLRVTAEGGGELALPTGALPTGTWQAVEPEPQGGLSLTVDVRGGARAAASPQEIEAARRPLASGPEEAAALEALARQAVGDAATPAEQVARLVAFVAEWVEDAWEPGALTLSQLLQRRRGDCTEHAALFTALARALGLPARTVAGLCWMGDAAGTFGGHAWSEVVLDGAWTPVDPTRGQTRIDAGHVRLGHEGGPSGLSLRGKLRFELLEARRGE